MGQYSAEYVPVLRKLLYSVAGCSVTRSDHISPCAISICSSLPDRHPRNEPVGTNLASSGPGLKSLPCGLCFPLCSLPIPTLKLLNVLYYLLLSNALLGWLQVSNELEFSFPAVSCRILYVISAGRLVFLHLFLSSQFCLCGCLSFRSIAFNSGNAFSCYVEGL